MGRILRRSCAVVAALVIPAAPAFAITNGSADGGGHPEVGGLVADHADPDGTWIYCSGTLISPTVFVTAAHCGDPGQTTATVSFDSHFDHASTGVCRRRCSRRSAMDRSTR